jgi:small subunit ribosomal protein S20
LAAKAPVKRNLSAEKRARQSEQRNARNRAVKSKVKGTIKAVETSLKAKDPDASAAALREAVKALTSASSKGIIHRNNASRKISRLTKRANAALKA